MNGRALSFEAFFVIDSCFSIRKRHTVWKLFIMFFDSTFSLLNESFRFIPFAQVGIPLLIIDEMSSSIIGYPFLNI